MTDLPDLKETFRQVGFRYGYSGKSSRTVEAADHRFAMEYWFAVNRDLNNLHILGNLREWMESQIQ